MSALPDPAGAQVRRLGWLHFLNDFTLDFITPLLPAGLGPAWLALAEGTADAIGHAVRVASARASDRQGRRAPWVRAGYAVNAWARALIALGWALGWPIWIAACRAADRLGKGLRAAAADALIADWTEGPERARAYARMRWMDHLGSALGGMAAAAAAWWLQSSDLWLAIVALALVAILVVLLARGLNDRAPRPATAASCAGAWWPQEPALRRPLAVLALAALALRASPLFVLAHAAGWPGLADTAALPLWQFCLLWAGLGLLQAGSAALAGCCTVRWGSRAVLRAGWLAAIALLLLLAVLEGPALLLAALAWGALGGGLEGTEKTWVAELAPAEERARAFAALGLITAAAALLGNGLLTLSVLGLGAAGYALLALAPLAAVSSLPAASQPRGGG